MRSFTKTTSVETVITPTPEDVAAVFWAMDDTEQARFFDKLGALVQETKLHGVDGTLFPLEVQLDGARRQCSPRALDVLRTFNPHT